MFGKDNTNITHGSNHSVGELALSPQAEGVAVEAAEERSIVDRPPEQQAIEPVRERQLADRDSDLIVLIGAGWVAVELQVAQMSVRVKAAEIPAAKIHQHLARLGALAGSL